jgi:hypothetical protein
MKRYYFDLRDGDDLCSDEEGMEMLDLEAVQEEAARALADMARDEVLARNGFARHLAIEVRDDNGPVMRAKFAFELERLQ